VLRAAHRTKTRHDCSRLLRRGEFFETKYRDRPVKARQLGVVTVFGQQDDIRTHDRDIGTLHRAITERVFGIEVGGELVAPPLPTVNFNVLLRTFRRRLLRRLPSMVPGSRQSFCDTYRGSRKARYELASLSLETSPLEEQDSEQTAFVKADKDNHTVKTDPAPRVILFRTARYNVEVGRHLKFLEHRLVAAIASVHGYPVITKGYSPRGVATILKNHLEFEADVIAIRLDASRYDQSLSEPFLKWEHSVYNATFRSQDLATWLRWQLRSLARGRCSDGTVSFRRIGGRGSGDMNTGMGNCLCMVALVSTFAEEICGREYRLANNGDDCVLFVPARFFAQICRQLSGFFLAAGIRMKVEGHTTVLEEIQFCQQRPVCINGVYSMVRQPRKAFSCDLVSTKCSNSLQARQHLMAVGVCGGVISCGVPVLQSFYSMLRRHGLGDARRLLMSDEYGHFGFTFMAYSTSSQLSFEISPVLPEARVSFWMAFGITPDQQRSLEQHFSSITAAIRSLGKIPSRSCKRDFDESRAKLPEWIHYALEACIES
jgi:hypothetical protein